MKKNLFGYLMILAAVMSLSLLSCGSDDVMDETSRNIFLHPEYGMEVIAMGHPQGCSHPCVVLEDDSDSWHLSMWTYSTDTGKVAPLFSFYLQVHDRKFSDLQPGDTIEPNIIWERDLSISQCGPWSSSGTITVVSKTDTHLVLNFDNVVTEMGFSQHPHRDELNRIVTMNGKVPFEL